MSISYASPLAVLTVIFLAFVALSHSEPALDALCEKQMVHNGFTVTQAQKQCARF